MVRFCFRTQISGAKTIFRPQKSKISGPGRKKKNLNFTLLEEFLEMGEDLLGEVQEDRIEP